MFKRSFVYFFAFAILFLSALSKAQAKDFGLGIILMGPTGVSTNYFFEKNKSIDTALSWDLNDDDQTFYLHSTYLLHKPKLIKIDRAALDLHFGGGARLISWDDRPGKHDKHDDELYLGLRAACGLSYTFERAIEIFSELSLTMDMIPDTDADVDFGIGARYYF